MVMTPVPQPSIEEVEDVDREPAIDPLPFDADGPIIIEVLLSITGSGSRIDSTEDIGEYEGCNGAGEENKVRAVRMMTQVMMRMYHSEIIVERHDSHQLLKWQRMLLLMLIKC
jgi:hypothetical protein